MDSQNVIFFAVICLFLDKGRLGPTVSFPLVSLVTQFESQKQSLQKGGEIALVGSFVFFMVIFGPPYLFYQFVAIIQFSFRSVQCMWFSYLFIFYTSSNNSISQMKNFFLSLGSHCAFHFRITLQPVLRVALLYVYFLILHTYFISLQQSWCTSIQLLISLVHVVQLSFHLLLHLMIIYTK